MRHRCIDHHFSISAVSTKVLALEKECSHIMFILQYILLNYGIPKLNSLVLPTTHWHNMNVNPKGLSSQIFLPLSPLDIVTRWLGIILKISDEGFGSF